MKNKVISLSQAAALVQDGQTIAMGGNTTHRLPASFARELARQGRRDLTLVKTAGAYDVDLLCLAGSLKAVHAGYIGFESEFGLAPNYRQAVEGGRTAALEHACYSVIAGLRASAYGVPFLPMAGMLGSDLLKHRDFQVIRDPFGSGQDVVLIPRLRPHWTIIHVHEADVQGNGRIRGSKFEDVLMSRAAEKVILTTERLVDGELFERSPETVDIPGFMVQAVVEAPGGGAPGSCLPYYDYDAAGIQRYLSLTPAQLDEYLAEVI